MNGKAKIYLFVILMTIALLLSTTAITVWAIYFASGNFKDVFVNKSNYFISDTLSSISSINDDKINIETSGNNKTIYIYNFNHKTGDFNAFDITYDIYAWTDNDLKNGRFYSISNDDGNNKIVSKKDNSTPIISNIILDGGKRTTKSITLSFEYLNENDLFELDTLNIAVVPTSPAFMSQHILGASFKPTENQSFSYSGKFVNKGTNTQDYAAFMYEVTTSGIAPADNVFVIMWKGDYLELLTLNGKPIDSTLIKDITTNSNYNKMIALTVQSSHLDSLTFARNTANEIWDSDVTFDMLASYVSINLEVEEGGE